jgi:hypothetical protein
MAVSVVSESIFQTKVGTEHVLMTVTSAGVFGFMINVGSHVLGDVAVLRIKTAVISGEALDVVFKPTLANCHSEPVIIVPPTISAYQIQYTVEVMSSGLSGSGVGSNGPPYAWRIDKVN